MFPIKYLAIFFASNTLALPGNPAAFATSVPTTTTTPNQASDCDYSYCDENHVSWCFHFVPFTTIDPTLGPMPGETRASVGVCGPQTAVPAPA
ncbi:hypothetical protein ACLX1H_005435, partial [Fusarium chlamydosporum]